MIKFKQFVNERNAIMQMYDKGMIDVKKFDMTVLKSDGLSDEEVLQIFGYNFNKDLKSLKILSKLKYYNEISYFGSLQNFDQVKGWLEGEEGWAYRMPSYLAGDENEIKGYYNQPKNKIEFLKTIKSMLMFRENYINSIKQEIEANTGIKFESIKIGMAWVSRYRNMSGRTIDKSVYPFLHALTVNKGQKLPKKIYRGLFMDGEKFAKMKPVEQEKYKVGNEVKLNNTKATSWSVSRGVAYNFMGAQDKIKDEKNGFELLLSYEIKSEEDVIADFRVFPEAKFWNQQEILLSPNVKFGKIEAIIKNGKEVKFDDIRFGDSGSTITIIDYIRNIVKLPNSNLPINIKIQLKELIDLPFKETVEKYPQLLHGWSDAEEILSTKGDMVTTLAVITEIPTKVLSPTKAYFENIGRYVTSWDLSHLFDKDIIDKETLEKYATPMKQYIIKYTMEITQNNPMRFDFIIDLQDIEFEWNENVSIDIDAAEKDMKGALKKTSDQTLLDKILNYNSGQYEKNVNYKLKKNF